MRIQRRPRLLAVACVLGVGLVTACGGGGGSTGAAGDGACEPAGEPVTLTFTSWVPGMQETVDLWNSQNPDIQVEYTEVVGGNGGTYQAYSNQLQAGTTGDLGMVEYHAMPNFRLQNGLANIGGCAPVAEGIGQYPEWTQEQVSFGEDGAVYGVPQDVGPLAFYYRTDLFQQAGIQPPTTWEEFAQAAAAVQAAGGLIANFMPDQPAWFTALAWQNGARWFELSGDGTWTVDMTDPATMEVAEYWQGLIDARQVNTIPGIGNVEWQALNSGQEWGLIGAAWTAKLLSTNAPDTTGRWAVVPLPQWGTGAAASGSWGGSATVVFPGTEHPYEAAQFAMWAFSDPEALALNNRNGGQFPAVTDVSTVPALTEPDPFFGGEVIWEDFAQANTEVDPSFAFGPTMNETFDALSNGFGQVVNGQGDLVSVLEDVQASTIATMQAQGLQVG